MKILVTGCKGQLGNELHEVLEAQRPGITTYVDREELDITDRDAVETFLRHGDFSHVINCAAYTAVDRAEDEKLACSAVNIDGISNIARVADDLGIRIIHISTDYVFDGHAYRPYTESDKVNPMSQYGTTKRKGETALLGLSPESIIIRTGWLYSPFGHNFVKIIHLTGIVIILIHGIGYMPHDVYVVKTHLNGHRKTIFGFHISLLDRLYNH